MARPKKPTTVAGALRELTTAVKNLEESTGLNRKAVIRIGPDA